MLTYLNQLYCFYTFWKELQQEEAEYTHFGSQLHKSTRNKRGRCFQMPVSTYLCIQLLNPEKVLNQGREGI